MLLRQCCLLLRRCCWCGLGLKPGPHQQQCRSNIVECYNVECCFDVVAVFGNNVEATFDFVAKTTTMSNEFCVEISSFRQSRTLLRHCCWCGRGLRCCGCARFVCVWRHNAGVFCLPLTFWLSTAEDKMSNVKMQWITMPWIMNATFT